MKVAISILLFFLLISVPAHAQEGVCSPYELRCEGETVQQCNTLGTQWIDMAECNTSCSNGQCNPELRINWEFIIAEIIALAIITAIVMIAFKRRKRPKPPKAL